MLILVEPYVHRLQGHNLDKLLIWRDGLTAKETPLTLVCHRRPPDSVAVGFHEIITTPRWLQKIIDRIPSRKYRARMTEMVVYRRAFALARRKRQPVFGLYCCTPVSVAAAAAGGGPPPDVWWGQILMDAGFYGRREGEGIVWRLRTKAERALAFLLRRRCRLLCNSPQTAEKLKETFPLFKDRVWFVADPQPRLTKPFPRRTKKMRRVLICGRDDWRRDNLGHAAALKQNGIVWMIKGIPDDETTPFFEGESVDRLDPSFHQDFSAVLSQADAMLLAYRPTFHPASGNLIAAVSAGTPVLASRFPFATEMFRRYGRLGELFSFGDVEDLRQAWRRLRAWEPQQWDEFDQARLAVVRDFNVEAVLGQPVFQSLLRKGLSEAALIEPSSRRNRSCVSITVNR